MSLSDRLVEAVKAGEVGLVARTLDAEPALVDARHDGVSLLLLALYYGHPGVAEVFASRRRRFDVHELAALGHAAELRDLLARMPEVAQQVAIDGFTPLGLAAFFCHEGAAVALLDAGADPTIRDELYDGTPGDWAAHFGQSEADDLLRAHASNERHPTSG
jgi:ankyrin repeat protein